MNCNETKSRAKLLITELAMILARNDDAPRFAWYIDSLLRFFDAHRYRGYLPGNSRIHLIVGLTVQVILGYHMQ